MVLEKDGCVVTEATLTCLAWYQVGWPAKPWRDRAAPPSRSGMYSRSSILSALAMDRLDGRCPYLSIGWGVQPRISRDDTSPNYQISHIHRYQRRGIHLHLHRRGRGVPPEFLLPVKLPDPTKGARILYFPKLSSRLIQHNY